MEAYASVRDFLETGGDVLLLLMVVTFGMWTLILERYWYYARIYPGFAERLHREWNDRSDHQTYDQEDILVGVGKLDLARLNLS